MNDTTKKKGWGRRALAAAAIAAALGFGFWAFRPQPLVVETAPVVTGRFEQAIREDGRLRVKSRYTLSAPTAAELARPTLKVGDRVEAGQVVASLTPAAPQMIDARTRRMLQERVGSAEAGRAAAFAQAERAKAAASQARLEAERSEKLASENFVATAVRDQAALTLRAQQRALDAAQAEVDVAGHALAEARAALTRAETGRDAGGAVPGRWDLRAPVAGRVIRLHQESAATVAVGAPLVEIADTAQLEAVVDVLSADALRVRPGAPVQLSPGTGLALLKGQVARIEPVAFTKVSALGIEEQRVNLVIDVDVDKAGSAALGDGYRVDATIVVAAQDGALLLPAAALERDGSRWAVWVADGGRAHKRGIDLRDRNADVAWVASGVTPGERVVLYPGGMVADGQRLALREGPKR